MTPMPTLGTPMFPVLSLPACWKFKYSAATRCLSIGLIRLPVASISADIGYVLLDVSTGIW